MSCVDAPQQLVALVFSFETQIFDVIGNLDQRCLEEAPNTLALIKELGQTHPRFWIGIEQPLVRLVYAWRYAPHLCQLVAATVAAVEDLEDQYAEVVCINGVRRILLDLVPSCFDNFWWHIPSSIWDEPAIGWEYGVIFLNRTQSLESSQLPLAAFTEIYRG